MKFICLGSSLFFAMISLGLPLEAQSNESKFIVIEEGKGALKSPQAHVESGKSEISGSPEEGQKPAFRSWEKACEKWKAELKSLNGSNLMVAECGRAKLSLETLQSKKIFQYSSQGVYKIRVVAK